MILNRPVFIESIGASPVDGYLARNGSLRPLTLCSDPLDDTGLPAASPLVDEATARAVQSVAPTIAAVAERVAAVAPFIDRTAATVARVAGVSATDARALADAARATQCAPAPADLERSHRDFAELEQRRKDAPFPDFDLSRML